MSYTIEELEVISSRHVEAAYWRAFWYGFAAGAGFAALVCWELWRRG